MQKETARIIRIGAANLAKTLTWRPPYDAVDTFSNDRLKIIPRQVRYVAKVKFAFREIRRVRTSQNRVRIHRCAHGESSLQRPEAETGTTAK